MAYGTSISILYSGRSAAPKPHAITLPAGSSGGAVYGSPGANLLMAYGTSLSGNNAVTGGAIHCDGCQQLTMTTEAIVQNNTADQGGGAYCSQCECVLLQDITFQDNM